MEMDSGSEVGHLNQRCWEGGEARVQRQVVELPLLLLPSPVALMKRLSGVPTADVEEEGRLEVRRRRRSIRWLCQRTESTVEVEPWLAWLEQPVVE